MKNRFSQFALAAVVTLNTFAPAPLAQAAEGLDSILLVNAFTETAMYVANQQQIPSSKHETIVSKYLDARGINSVAKTCVMKHLYSLDAIADIGRLASQIKSLNNTGLEFNDDIEASKNADQNPQPTLINFAQNTYLDVFTSMFNRRIQYLADTKSSLEIAAKAIVAACK